MKDWFFHQERGKTLGPITIDEVKSRIRDGRIRLTDLVFRDGEAGWKMALEHSELRPEFKSTVHETLKDRPWVVLQRKNEASFEFVTSGPYDEPELKKAIMAGKVSYSDYVWRDGFKEWRRIGSLTEFNRRAGTGSSPPVVPPLPDIPTEDALKNVVEFRRPRQLQPEAPPPEALDPEDQPTVIRPPPVPVDEPPKIERRKLEAPPPEKLEAPVAAETTAEDVVLNQTSTKTKHKKSLLVDWGIVAGLAMMLIAAVFAASVYLRSPPQRPEEVVEASTTEATSPVAQPTDPAITPVVANTGGTPVTEDPPAEAPAAEKKPAPTELYLAAQTVNSNQVRIEVRTDANADWPVYVQIVGLPGQVSDGTSFYRYLKFTPSGDGAKPLDLSGVKLPQGRFFFRVTTGDLKKEAKLSVGVNEQAYKNAVVRLRKQHAHAIWAERLQLFRLAQELERGITEALGGKKFSAKGLSPLLAVKRSNGANYILYDQWFDLKEILQAAQTGSSQAVLERARKARERLASFSVWK